MTIDRRSVAAFLAVLALAGTGLAQTSVVLDEVLGSWQGDATVQFVELRLLDVGQQAVAGAELAFDDASGDPDRRRFFTFTRGVAQGVQNARILVATQRLAQLAGVQPDFVLPEGTLASPDGRVCYQVRDQSGTPAVIDCVAFGQFQGDNAPFGRPTPVTPDNRSLERVRLQGTNRADWAGQLQPTPQNNAGAGAALETLCGDERISQGEECDGRQLAGKACADLGFARGKLRCTQCHFDATKCTFCGDGDVDPGEQCDGAAVGEQTCDALGFTGGTLGCTDRCDLSTASCDPTFFVPGGGPAGLDCLGEWMVTNGTARPSASGKAPARQRCRDGDPACDTDAGAGTCTFAVAVCLGREDARLAQCQTRPVDGWTLLRPAPGQDDALAVRLVGAVAALGSSTTTGNAVGFAPPLDVAGRCTAPLTVVVTRRGAGAGTLVLRARVDASGRRDADALKLVCMP